MKCIIKQCIRIYSCYNVQIITPKVRIYVILGEWSMHLALIEAMYKLKMIGNLDNTNRPLSIGGQIGQGLEEPKYFVIGVEKDEWDIKGNDKSLFTPRLIPCILFLKNKKLHLCV